MVLTCAVVFFLVCLVVAVKLFMASTALTGLQEILAIAGFLVAAGEFRNVLGLSRAQGTSALEVAILGIPLTLLAGGLAISTVRGFSSTDSAPVHERATEQPPPPSGTASDG